MPFASSARDALELAMTEAHRLQSRTIGTEHLLLGILTVASSNPGKDALLALGMEPDACRKIVRQHAGADEDRGPVEQ